LNEVVPHLCIPGEAGKYRCPLHSAYELLFKAEKSAPCHLVVNRIHQELQTLLRHAHVFGYTLDENSGFVLTQKRVGKISSTVCECFPRSKDIMLTGNNSLLFHTFDSCAKDRSGFSCRIAEGAELLPLRDRARTT